MSIISLKFLLIICFSFLSLSFCKAEEKLSDESVNPAIVKIQEYSDLKITELVLKNGMRVVLKHTDDDSEISIRLAAAGGYAAMSADHRASGELASSCH